jgi:hypothetical protein
MNTLSSKTVLTAKCCFEHLGGTLGSRLFYRMTELGWLEPTEENPRYFKLTELGINEFLKLGVDHMTGGWKSEQ